MKKYVNNEKNVTVAAQTHAPELHNAKTTSKLKGAIRKGESVWRTYCEVRRWLSLCGVPHSQLAHVSAPELRLVALQQLQVRALAASGVEDLPPAARVGAVGKRPRHLRGYASKLRSKSTCLVEGAARANRLVAL